jgi:hypothetical protein
MDTEALRLPYHLLACARYLPALSLALPVCTEDYDEEPDPHVRLFDHCCGIPMTRFLS